MCKFTITENHILYIKMISFKYFRLFVHEKYTYFKYFVVEINLSVSYMPGYLTFTFRNIDAYYIKGEAQNARD